MELQPTPGEWTLTRTCRCCGAVRRVGTKKEPPIAAAPDLPVATEREGGATEVDEGELQLPAKKRREDESEGEAPVSESQAAQLIDVDAR